MFLDDDLKELLCKIVSSLLPHENFNGMYFSTILTETFKLIHLEEMSMEYYVIFHILDGVGKVKLPFQEAILKRDAFQDVISNFILNEANSEKIGLKDYLLLHGEATDLTNIENREKAMNILYTLSLRLYDAAYAAAIPSGEYPALILSLREAVVNTLAYECITAQGNVLRDGMQVGRNFLFGPNDWLSYVKSEIVRIENRLPEDTADSSVLLDNPSKGRELIESLQSKGTKIADYGLPLLDDETPISRNRLVILAGNPNIGKTSVMLSWCINIIMSGGKVAVLSGESAPGKIYVQLLSAYIKRKYDISIPVNMISHLDQCSPEVVRLIQLYQSEFSSLNQLLIQEQFSYDTFYDQALSLREKFEYDVLFVDHTLSMANLTDHYMCLEKLAVQARNLKNKYPVCVCLLSHLSTETQKELKEGRDLEAPCTKHNGTLESEADEILLLTTNPEFRKQRKLSIINKKRRDAAVVQDAMIVRVDFQFKSLSYHEEDQVGNAAEYMAVENAIDTLRRTYGVEDDEDDDY